jgi:uncharacterized protein (TIGR02271 family)
MNEETIVAVYDTATHADAAMRELQDSGIPASAITRHSMSTATDATPQPPREQGFWSSLFGGEPEYDPSVYEQTLAAGSHVVTVKADESRVAAVSAILERHNPIDIDERAATYGLGKTSGTAAAGMASGVDAAGGAATAARPDATRAGEERLSLAEEQLSVGKRLVNRGTTRIRRYVVETPVEENVALHSEHVSVERRPVAGETRVGDANFTDRTIEVSETDEEAVVGKTARVREEVVVRKDVADRVETVRDTVRREDVEITKDDKGEANADRGIDAVPPVRR